jgi:hypothetical protein
VRPRPGCSLRPSSRWAWSQRTGVIATASCGGAGSFGGTLEWYVGRELRRWLGFDVATGVKFHARGIGGDLDLVAAAEGKLIYVELKSSPPKHLSKGEVGAFFDRVRLVRPDLALFVVDTALRSLRQGRADVDGRSRPPF